MLLAVLHGMQLPHHVCVALSSIRVTRVTISLLAHCYTLTLQSNAWLTTLVCALNKYIRVTIRILWKKSNYKDSRKLSVCGEERRQLENSILGRPLSYPVSKDLVQHKMYIRRKS